MTTIAVLGAGAFGTSLAITLALNGRPVTLWGRDVDEMAKTRENTRRLPGVTIPDLVTIEPDLAKVDADVLLMAVPMQTLDAFLAQHSVQFERHVIVSCCKGVDLTTGLGPAELIARHCPEATAAVLTGPSFAADIAQGLPTALTLACEDKDTGETLQEAISGDTLRLYLTTDVKGAELGGALKNVIALAAGMTMGAGLGESARAALITRGFAEMQRVAAALGADPDTLTGLSGMGDLILTAMSEKSRNYRAGLALGAGENLPDNMTVEGAATAVAVRRICRDEGVDAPLTGAVAAILDGEIDVETAKDLLLSRPLKEE